MAQKKKSATRKPKPKAAATEPQADPAETLPLKDRTLGLLFQPKLLLVAALLGAGFVLAPAASRYVPDLSQRSEYRLRTAEIVIPTAPRWIPQNLVDQVIRKADLPDEVSVLDPELGQRIAAAFEEHAWVTKPVKVTISVPARIEVAFAWREPVAMVQISDGYYPVDFDGVLLPPRDFPPSELDHYPRIVGMGTTPLNGVGLTWGDARVIGAARLAAVLAPYWTEWELSAIQVPERLQADQKYEDLDFSVTTRGGSRILWGRPPGHGHPLEITEEQKIGRLQDFLARSKAFDGPWEVNINHLMEISYRALNASRATSRD